MLLRPITPLLISGLVLFITTLAHAQPKDNSPFSQFGIGDFFETNLPNSHSMGGLNAVYHDFFESNFDNPASLGFLQYTSFQLGFFGKSSTYKRIEDKQGVWTGNMDHLSLSFPIINPLNEALERRETDFSWGTGVSLQPYSQVGYNVSINDSLPEFGDIQRSFQGTGGLYKITWANGLKYKNLSAGINIGYNYGKQSFKEVVNFIDLQNAYRDDFTTTVAYKGVSYRFGLMYEHPLDLKEARANDDNPSRLLSAGLYYGSQTSLDTKSDILQLSVNPIISDVDTAFYQEDAPGEAMLPSQWGFGLMYRKAGDFRVGVNYEAATWSDYSNTARTSEMKDSYRIGAGVAWIPDANSITSYFRRVEYRAGFSTGTDPRVIEGSQVKQNTFSVGANFPLILQRNIAWFQLGFDYGTRKGGDRLSESFVRGKVGFIFNDNTWFIKGKYN